MIAFERNGALIYWADFAVSVAHAQSSPGVGSPHHLAMELFMSRPTE